MSTNNSNELVVFLCHASQDKSYIHTLYKKLERDGFSPWLDAENLLPGQNWDYEIKLALRKANAIIVCLSTNSVDKAGYVQKEIKIALDLAEEQPDGSIFLIPARIEDCDIPKRLEHLHSPEIHKEQGYQRLVEALKIRATKLNRRVVEADQVNIGSAEIAENIVYKEMMCNYFRRAFVKLYWDSFDELKLKSSGVFTVNLVGPKTTGKSSLVYMLTKEDFNFLQYQPKTDAPYDYKVPLQDKICVIDHGSNLFEARIDKTLTYIKENSDLIFFMTSTNTKFGIDDYKILEKLLEIHTPLAIIANKMDRFNSTLGCKYLQQIQEITNQIPLPISVLDGVNIDLLMKFIVKGRKMYL